MIDRGKFLHGTPDEMTPTAVSTSDGTSIRFDREKGAVSGEKAAFGQHTVKY